MEPGVFLGRDVDGDSSGAGSSLVDLFAGLRRHDQTGTGLGMGLPFQLVSPGQAAGGVDENGFHFIGKRIGKPDLGAAFLKQFVQTAAAIQGFGYNASSATGALRTGLAEAFKDWLLHVVSEGFADAETAFTEQSVFDVASTTICPSVFWKKSHILSAASTCLALSSPDVLRSTAGCAFGVTSLPGLRVRTAEAAMTSDFIVARGHA